MLPLIISFLSLLLFNPVASKCVSRNSSLTTHQNPSPPSAQTLVPPPPIASRPPPPLAVPPPPSPPQAVPPPHVTTPPQNPPPKKTESSPKGFIGGIVSGVASSILSNACKQTDYPEICMETLTPFTVGLQSAKPDDPTALLKISIAAAVAETKSVIKAADKLMAENAGSASFVSILEDCRENYNDALDNYQSALDAIPENDLGTINSMLSAAVTDYGTCDDGFMGTNPLINQDEKLSHMGSNCLVMASLLEHI